MQNVTLDKVIKEVKSLPREDLKQLRDVLDDLLEIESRENEADRLMIEAGLITETKKPKRASNPVRKYKPITVKGKPVSETLLEERR